MRNLGTRANLLARLLHGPGGVCFQELLYFVSRVLQVFLSHARRRRHGIICYLRPLSTELQEFIHVTHLALHYVACLADRGHCDGAWRAAFGPTSEEIFLHICHGFPVIVDGPLAVDELFFALIQLLGQLQVLLLLSGQVVLKLTYIILQVRQVQVLVKRVDLRRILLRLLFLRSELLLARFVPEETGFGRVCHLACIS